MSRLPAAHLADTPEASWSAHWRTPLEDRGRDHVRHREMVQARDGWRWVLPGCWASVAA